MTILKQNYLGDSAYDILPVPPNIIKKIIVDFLLVISYFVFVSKFITDLDIILYV